MAALRVAWLILVLTPTLMVGAQDEHVPYVDVRTTQSEIQEIRGDIASRSEENQDLQRENEELLSDIRRDQERLIEIDPIRSRVAGQLTELYAVNSTIVDLELKQRSQAAIGRARIIKNDLERQMRELNERIRENRESLDANRLRIRINNRRIAENEDRIIYLEAAIDRTDAQRARIDRFITDVDAILRDAEQFLEGPRD